MRATASAKKPNGDPFTVYYGLLFLPFAAFPPTGDVNRTDWFREGLRFIDETFPAETVAADPSGTTAA